MVKLAQMVDLISPSLTHSVLVSLVNESVNDVLTVNCHWHYEKNSIHFLPNSQSASMRSMCSMLPKKSLKPQFVQLTCPSSLRHSRYQVLQQDGVSYHSLLCLCCLSLWSSPRSICLHSTAYQWSASSVCRLSLSLSLGFTTALKDRLSKKHAIGLLLLSC